MADVRVLQASNVIEHENETEHEHEHENERQSQARVALTCQSTPSIGEASSHARRELVALGRARRSR